MCYCAQLGSVSSSGSTTPGLASAHLGMEADVYLILYTGRRLRIFTAVPQILTVFHVYSVNVLLQ